MGAITHSPLGLECVGALDISGYQFAYAGSGKIKPDAKRPDWAKARVAGISAILHRIGNGTSFDESFHLGYEGWLTIGGPDSGLDYGAYYYLQPGLFTPVNTARMLVSWLDMFAGGGTVKVMLDLEEYNGRQLGRSELTNWLRNVCDELADRLGYEPMLYAGNAFANPNTLVPTFADLFTWQPRYARNGVRPPVPVSEWGAWQRWDRTPTPNTVIGAWDAWQFSSDGLAHAYGCPIDGSERIDCNLIPLARYREILINQPVIPAPATPPIIVSEEDDDMPKIIIQDQLQGGAAFLVDGTPVSGEVLAELQKQGWVVLPQSHEHWTAAVQHRNGARAAALYATFGR